MDRTMILDAYDPQCPIRNILARMSDKWSLLVIYALSQVEKMRFGDIRRAGSGYFAKDAYRYVKNTGRGRICYKNDLSGSARRVWNTRLRLGRIHFCRIFNR